MDITVTIPARILPAVASSVYDIGMDICRRIARETPPAPDPESLFPWVPRDPADLALASEYFALYSQMTGRPQDPDLAARTVAEIDAEISSAAARYRAADKAAEAARGTSDYEHACLERETARKALRYAEYG